MPRVNFVGNSALFAAVQANSTVYDSVLVGNLLYTCGDFTTVADRSGTYARAGGACLNLSTGLWSSFNAGVSGGSAFCIESDGTYLYIGGSFSAVVGAANRYLVRYALATGAVDAGWDLTPSDSSPFLCMKFMNGKLYIGGNLGGATFNSGSVTRAGVMRLTSGSIDSWQPNLAPIFFYGGNIYGFVDLGSGNVGLSGGFHYINNAPGTHYQARDFAVVASDGTIQQTPQGYYSEDTFSSGQDHYNAVVIGSLVYLAGYHGVTVFDEPLNTTNPSSRGGYYACSFTGVWSSTWNPAINNADSKCRYILNTSDNALIMAGRFLGTDLLACALRFDSTTGARDSGFSLQYASYVGDNVMNTKQYGSMLIVMGNINNTIQGRACAGFVFANANTGNLVP